MEMMIPKQIQLEKIESDLAWDETFKEVIQGKMDFQKIAWSMNRCNEVEKMILKIKHDNFEE